MTVARKKQGELHISRYYHCVSRCVCQAMLCGEGNEHDKQQIEDVLEVLADIYAIAVCGSAVMGPYWMPVPEFPAGKATTSLTERAAGSAGTRKARLARHRVAA